MIPDFENKLQKYADLIIRIGLNLQPGQRLLIRAPILANPLVEKLTQSAYQAGASLVIPNYNNENLTRLRFEYAPRDSFSEFPEWMAEGIARHLETGNAMLSIYAEDPDLLKGKDSELMALAQKTTVQHMARASNSITRNAINWNLISYPVPSWARKLFPDLSDDQAIEKLWNLIFQVCRVDQPDPIAAWQEHIRQLDRRSSYMQARQYSALHYRGPGTDLTLGLPQGHRWISAGFKALNGVSFVANIPTEEIFTLPDCHRADGVVTASMPLSYGGAMIEDFVLEFKGGRVIEARARKGEEFLRKVLETDEGAARLGEVALVPHSSPISQSGVMFYNTLFDENAASHIALGRAYRFSLTGGVDMSDETFSAAGGNYSLIHIDFMVGNAQLDLDGITVEGIREPLMRQGEWAFNV